MAPRSAARVILRMRWLAPSFSYWAAETAWTWVRRRITADRPIDRTTSSAMARRAVRRPAVAARPAWTLARRAAMRRFGLGRPTPAAVVARTRGVLGVGRLSLGPGAKVGLHLRPTAGQARRGGIVVSGLAAGILGNGRHEVGDLGRDDHAQPLLGGGDDAVGGRELGHVEAELLVPGLLLRRHLVDLVEPELRLDQEDVEDGGPEDRPDGEDGAGRQGQPQGPVGRRGPTGGAPHPALGQPALVQLADAGSRRRRPARLLLEGALVSHDAGVGGCPPENLHDSPPATVPVAGRTRSRTRRRALSARGLAAPPAAQGRAAPRVTSRAGGASPGIPVTGRPRGTGGRDDQAGKGSFTIRSSSEWEDSPASPPPRARAAKAASRPGPR